jgi:uncharacterized protein
MTLDRRQSARRSFLGGTVALGACPLAAAFGSLHARFAQAQTPGAAASALIASPYGPIAPVNDETTGLSLVRLPRGFSYKSYGWTSDPMSDGQRTPGNHDGMGVIASRRAGITGTELVLVRNHERGTSTRPISAPSAAYDGAIAPDSKASPGGGTTTLVWRDGNWVSALPSLSGTLTNCAGGVTPWGTWLSCEETLNDRSGVVGSNGVNGRKHGYVFEVPADPKQTSAQPIVGMGRFRHEAAAVDPATGHVYLTEDGPRVSGFYRYEPKVARGAHGSLLKGGVLKMARLRGVRDQAVLLAPALGDRYTLDWVTLDHPDADPVALAAGALPLIGAVTVSGCFNEGYAKGGARMSRGEGLWYWNRRIYIVDTTGGRATAGGVPGDGKGCVWQLDLDTQTLTCICAVPPGASNIGNNFDNITVSPKGGLLLCEDGGEHQHNGQSVGVRLMGVASGGATYALAENNLTSEVLARAHALGKDIHGMPTPNSQIGGEFAGACFDPAGRVLFVNMYSIGATLAISGPWGAGPL